jgi:hypothetical protein
MINTTPHSLYLTKDRTNVIEWGDEQNFSSWVQEVQKDVKVVEEKTLYEKKPMWEEF